MCLIQLLSKIWQRSNATKNHQMVSLQIFFQLGARSCHPGSSLPPWHPGLNQIMLIIANLCCQNVFFVNLVRILYIYQCCSSIQVSKSRWDDFCGGFRSLAESSAPTWSARRWARCTRLPSTPSSPASLPSPAAQVGAGPSPPLARLHKMWQSSRSSRWWISKEPSRATQAPWEGAPSPL